MYIGIIYWAFIALGRMRDLDLFYGKEKLFLFFQKRKDFFNLGLPLCHASTSHLWLTGEQWKHTIEIYKIKLETGFRLKI